MKAQTGRGFTWYWTPRLWGWNPAEGPWQPKYGGPKTAAYLELTTAGMHPRESYDFWCESVFYSFDPDPRPVRAADPFHARARGWCSPRGNVFAYESGPMAGKRPPRRADNGGDLEIGVILAGTRFYQSHRGHDIVSNRGDFFVYDPGRPCRINWTAHQGVHITVRRSNIVEAFAGHIPGPDIVAQRLAGSPLAPFLRSHLTLLAKTMTHLSAPEQSVLTDQLIDLLLMTLRGAVSDHDSQTDRDRRALFSTAQSYIDAHLGEPNLNIDQITQAVGCSRSTLYRAFSEQGETVSRYIRERRLHWFWQLLQDAPAQTTIGDLALRCGFDNIGYVSKQFRRHFGITPREVRAMAQRDMQNATVG